MSCVQKEDDGDGGDGGDGNENHQRDGGGDDKDAEDPSWQPYGTARRTKDKRRWVKDVVMSSDRLNEMAGLSLHDAQRYAHSNGKYASLLGPRRRLAQRFSTTNFNKCPTTTICPPRLPLCLAQKARLFTAEHDEPPK